VFRENGKETSVDVPAAALRLLAGALAEMGKGNAVVVAPIRSELTTNEAAALLGVSRPFLIRLIDDGKIPAHKVGNHRRLLMQDVLSYKQRSRKDRLKALKLLAAQAQELDMGY
jgi:excisionase family DNA binding protein